MLGKNQTYRAFTVRPSHVLGLNGEVLEGAPVLAKLTSEIRGYLGLRYVCCS